MSYLSSTMRSTMRSIVSRVFLVAMLPLLVMTENAMRSPLAWSHSLKAHSRAPASRSCHAPYPSAGVLRKRSASEPSTPATGSVSSYSLPHGCCCAYCSSSTTAAGLTRFSRDRPEPSIEHELVGLDARRCQEAAQHFQSARDRARRAFLLAQQPQHQLGMQVLADLVDHPQVVRERLRLVAGQHQRHRNRGARRASPPPPDAIVVTLKVCSRRQFGVPGARAAIHGHAALLQQFAEQLAR